MEAKEKLLGYGDDDPRLLQILQAFSQDFFDSGPRAQKSFAC